MSSDRENSESSDGTLLALVHDGAAPRRAHNEESLGTVVNWENTPSFDDVSVLMTAGVEIEPGQFVGVLHSRDKDIITVVQVRAAFERNPNEIPELAVARRRLSLDAAYGTEEQSTRIFRLAMCTTVEQFSLLPGTLLIPASEGRAPTLLARAGDEVVRLSNELIQASIGGLAQNADGLHLGETTGPQRAPVTLRPDLLQYHVGIFGNPGRGKSYLAGALLEEARAWDIPTLVIDVNGEFRETARALGGEVIKLPDSSRLGLALQHITPAELVAITPGVQAGTVYADLIEVAHEGLRTKRSRGSGEISFDELCDEIAVIGQRTKAAALSINAAVGRIRQLEKDELVARVSFDFIAELEKHRLLVLDCRYLSLKQTRLIAAVSARELQRVGRQRARAAETGDKQAAEWFSLLAIDEAHVVIPDDDRTISTQVLYELARMGRHVRTGLLLSSQSPADLNSSVLKKLQTRFIFALERDQLRAIPGVAADLDDSIVAQLPKLSRGICAVSGASEIIRHGFLMSVRKRTTPFGGSTPPVFSGRVKGTSSGVNDA